MSSESPRVRNVPPAGDGFDRRQRKADHVERQSDEKAGDGPGDANFEHGAPILKRLALHDDRAHGAEDADGEGDEVGQRDRSPAQSANHIVPGLVRHQNAEQRAGIHQAGSDIEPIFGSRADEKYRDQRGDKKNNIKRAVLPGFGDDAGQGDDFVERAG